MIAWVGIRPLRDELAAGLPRRDCERCRPSVLPDDYAGRAARIHRGGEVLQVLEGEDLGHFPAEHGERGLVEVLVLEYLDVAGLFLSMTSRSSTRTKPRSTSEASSSAIAPVNDFVSDGNSTTR